MLNKHILGIFVLILIFGVGVVLVNTLASIRPLILLAIGLFAGYLIGIIIPAISLSLHTALQRKPSADNKTLYVGNLPFRTTRFELRELFQPYGKIHSARIVIDRATRKPRGYGFVEMDSEGAVKAINSLNGHTLAGRNLKVSEANDRDQA
jgi:hypothetical protein